MELPDSLSNRTPSLRLEWNAEQLGITGQELGQLLLDTEPRIALGAALGSRPDRMQSSILVTPWMMMPGEDKIVAERLCAGLTNHPRFPNPLVPQGQLASVAGQWLTVLTFARGSAKHRVVLEQQGGALAGTHYGEYGSGDLTGTVIANQVRFHSSQKSEGQRLSYEFAGVIENGKMAGTVNLGEYGMADWTAVRHQYTGSPDQQI